MTPTDTLTLETFTSQLLKKHHRAVDALLTEQIQRVWPEFSPGVDPAEAKRRLAYTPDGTWACDGVPLLRLYPMTAAPRIEGRKVWVEQRYELLLPEETE